MAGSGAITPLAGSSMAMAGPSDVGGGHRGLARAPSSTPAPSRTVSGQIRKQLDTVVSPKSKLTKPIKKPKATWVEPSFTAEVEFRDVTSEGLLRQSSFKGLTKGTRRP
jgi:hypothetical protein